MTTLAPDAARVSPSVSLSGMEVSMAPSGQEEMVSRRACPTTRQPAFANALAAAVPRRPLAPRIRTVFMADLCGADDRHMRESAIIRKLMKRAGQVYMNA